MTDVRILSVRVTPRTYGDAIAELLAAARDKRQVRAHFCTVHSLVEATGNQALRQAFESAGRVFTDGVPLVWVSRLRGAGEAERVCGPDVLLTLADRGREHALRHFFLGGEPGVAESLADALTKRYPGLAVAGTHAPPFRPLSETEDQALVERIQLAAPDVLWIGLGSPKQELWAAEHEQRLSVPLILPVGAAFDFHSERVRRAPRWMRRVGLEWLFRLAMEPRRLFRRYLVTNTRFVLMVTAEELRRRIRRRDKVGQ